MSKNWTEVIKPKALVGQNAMNASQESSFWDVSGSERAKLDALIRMVANSTDEAMRQRFLSAMTAPIMLIIPYVELYDRFFVTTKYGDGEDVLHPAEVVPNIVTEVHPQSGVIFNQPSYTFSRPTFSTFSSGVKIPWNSLSVAAWPILERQMNQVMWEISRKRDAKAKTAIDNALPVSHILSHTGGVVKSSVDYIIKESNRIGFPVTQAVINPGRLMEMQSWTWTMPNIPEAVATALVQNLYYGQYGGVNWFVNPNASSTQIYFGGDSTSIGWHDMKGSSRTDRDMNIETGEDLVAIRDPLHAWTVENALPLWRLDII